MTDDLKPMPDVIWVEMDEDGEITALEYDFSIHDTIAKRYVRADTIPAPEKSQLTHADLTAAYMVGKTSNAPEKIDGVQEAYDKLTELYNFSFDENPAFAKFKWTTWAEENKEIIKRALIQAGAVE